MTLHSLIFKRSIINNAICLSWRLKRQDIHTYVNEGKNYGNVSLNFVMGSELVRLIFFKMDIIEDCRQSDNYKILRIATVCKLYVNLPIIIGCWIFFFRVLLLTPTISGRIMNNSQRDWQNWQTWFTRQNKTWDELFWHLK